MSKNPLSHLNARGEAHMVDVSGKATSQRRAIARGFVSMQPATLALIQSGGAKKGDVLATARIAGIMAAKKTHELIPLCHPLMISKATVDFTPSSDPAGIDVTAEVRVSGQTGVEMEALTAVSVACLTIYDMLKAVDKAMTFSGIRLIEKSGGRSGHYRADKAPAARRKRTAARPGATTGASAPAGLSDDAAGVADAAASEGPPPATSGDQPPWDI